MATEKTDVVIVGMGAAGGVLAAELGAAGMKVIGLERGPRLKTADFQLDELRYFQRQDLRPDRKRQPVTWRANADTRATPIPQQNYGNQAGGGTVHYGTVSWRLHEDDFRARSQTIERYGASAIPQDSSLADWPLSYADLEPYYDRAEYELGVSGKAGNLQGRKIDGGNVFEAPRYPIAALSGAAGLHLLRLLPGIRLSRRREVVDPGHEATRGRCDRQLPVAHRRHVLPREQQQQRACDRHRILWSRRLGQHD